MIRTSPAIFGGDSSEREKARLTNSRWSRAGGYGSVLCTEARSKPSRLKEVGAEMPDGEEFQLHDDHRAATYRRIAARSVLLPKRAWYKSIRVPGVYNQTSPHSNVVHTTKYTIITFFPKNLWEQFHRLANIYFLFIAVLNFVPSLGVFGKEIGFIPITYVLSVTALKDVFEDYRRYRSDREVNSKLCQVYDWYVCGAL